MIAIYIISGIYICTIIGFFIGMIDGVCSIDNTSDIIKLIKNIVRGLIGGSVIGGFAGGISGSFIYIITQFIM